ncbi:integral membrane protein PTH11-like protein [Aspergillus heteromorphus CBS 117.55]|uniref:Integral membrane protein PTH11-like protein n=1 Tax=Aspergillus heteromorphus CBS 117.55 TaxID=1448321 RepID=A0A317X5U6_9EURO|nr:integral membrane protein PTH11-like protein [Aspergillus heteromorphus CBS 117.55]PWY92927.1 integral membrane protein PTH11-like protein [Aspergillus heteromorphus CBS 117.55]
MSAATHYSAAYLAQSRVTEVIVGYSVPIPLEILTTGWRIWIQLRPSSKNGLAFDDYLILWATIIGVGVCASGLYYGPPYGFGRHVAALPTKEVETFMKGDYIFSHFYDVAIASTKLSVLALYYRIFITPKFRFVVIGTVVWVILWLMTMEIVLGLECRPIQKFWDSSVHGTCFNLVAFSYFTNITNLVTDIWIFLLPVPVILKLQITRNKKVGLSLLFSVGLATCAISAARLTVVVTQGSTDYTWAGVPLGILSAWEPLGGILCANLPLIYKSLASIFTSLKSTLQSRTTRSGANNNTSPSSNTHDYNHTGHTHAHKSSITASQHASWLKLHNGSAAGNSFRSEVEALRSFDEEEEDEDGFGGWGVEMGRVFEQEVGYEGHREGEGDEMPLRGR